MFITQFGQRGGFVELVVQGKRQVSGTPQYGSTYFGGHFERLVTGLMGDGFGCKKWCVVVRVGGLQVLVLFTESCFVGGSQG